VGEETDPVIVGVREVTERDACRESEIDLTHIGTQADEFGDHGIVQGTRGQAGPFLVEGTQPKRAHYIGGHGPTRPHRIDRRLEARARHVGPPLGGEADRLRGACLSGRRTYANLTRGVSEQRIQRALERVWISGNRSPHATGWVASQVLEQGGIIEKTSGCLANKLVFVRNPAGKGDAGNGARVDESEPTALV
jgi:hypothetical protein